MSEVPAETATPTKRRKVLAIVLLVIGLLVAVGGVLLALNMRGASLETASLLAQDVAESGSLDYLPIYRMQYFLLGVGVTSAVAGGLLFLGALIRLLIRR